MAEWPDPRSISVGAAFGHTAYEDPTGLTYDQISPGADSTDPGDVLGSIVTKRGRISDAGETTPTIIELRLRDEAGRYSPRNVSGPHFGDLRKGTPLEVAVDVGSGPQGLARAAAWEWSPIRDAPETNERVLIRAYGPLQLLGRDTASYSPIRHTILGASPHAYWPLEDGTDATVGGSAVPLSGLAQVAGDVAFGQDDGLPGSLAAPDLSAGALRMTVPEGGSSSSWCVEFWFKGPYSAGSYAAWFIVFAGAATTLYRWNIRLPASASGNLDLLVHGPTGTLVDTISAPVTGWLDTDWHHVAITAALSVIMSQVTVNIYIDGSFAASDTIAATTTLGRVADIYANEYELADYSRLDSIAHVAVVDGVTPTGAGEAGDAYEGELAGDRIVRIFAEAGITAEQASSLVDPATMGRQPVATKYQIAREAEDADAGVLHETRAGRARYTPNSSRYNDSAILELAFDPEITDLLQFDDDRDLYNIVEVTSSTGTPAVAEDRDSAVGSDPVSGVGPRRLPVTRNLHLASELTVHAGWLLRRHTVDKPRYVVVLDLLALPELAVTAVASDIGARVQITGATPEHEGPDTLDLVIEGEQIEGGADRFLVAWFCEPYEPWRVQQLADTPPDSNVLDGWLTPTTFTVDGSDFDAGTDTSMDVAVTPAITTDASVLPLRIRAVGLGWVGEVTNVGAASGGVQTLTITQTPLNGVEKTIPVGTDLELVDPLVLAL